LGTGREGGARRPGFHIKTTKKWAGKRVGGTRRLRPSKGDWPREVAAVDAGLDISATATGGTPPTEGDAGELGTSHDLTVFSQRKRWRNLKGKKRAAADVRRVCRDNNRPPVKFTEGCLQTNPKYNLCTREEERGKALRWGGGNITNLPDLVCCKKHHQNAARLRGRLKANNGRLENPTLSEVEWE